MCMLGATGDSESRMNVASLCRDRSWRTLLLESAFM